jgi:hypothetical protein
MLSRNKKIIAKALYINLIIIYKYIGF